MMNRTPFSSLNYRVIVLMLAYALFCPCEAISQAPIAKADGAAFRYQSITLVAWGGTHFYDAGQSGLQNIDQIVASGANDITLQTISGMRDTTASSFTSTLDDPTVYADIKKAALYAKSRGLTVTLKPHIQLKGFGVLQNASYSPPDGDAFFASVKHDLANHVRLANDVGAHMLVIGTEMGGKITSPHSETGYDNCTAWHKIIADIRKAAPSLKLTYAATLTNTWNKLESNEAPRICFWDALDFLGFDAYPDMNGLSETAGPAEFYKRMFDNGNAILNGGDDGTADSVFSLHNFILQYKITNQSQVKYIEFVANAIRARTKRPGMPVIITEIGTPSTTDAFQYWGSQAGTINFNAQAAGWDGVMKALTEIPMVEGINIWSVNPWHAPTDTNNKKWQMDWDPVGKPAYQVIKKWFSGAESGLLWSSADSVRGDSYVAFRGDFTMTGASKIQLQVSGASWYVIWVDGNYFYEGPDRYHKDYPEYQSKDLSLAMGSHTLAVEVHYEGLDTRILKSIQPFLFCRIMKEKEILPIDWKCLGLNAHQNQFRRINDQLGWVEWLDARKLPYQWQLPEFDDSGWKRPVNVERNIGHFTASKIANVKSIEIDPVVIGSGKLAEVFGYELDNPSARFFLRDLECKTLPAQGVWRRYDLGKIVLSRPKFVLDLPAGTVVEFAYCEQLQHGRVSPWIPLSASDSYNLDHIVARGGVQEFFPLTPKGGRFMEVHIFAGPESIRWISERSLVRSYYDHVEGSFACNDSLLNKIWRVGIDTYLSCSEDALIDNPTRERGQWLGDVGIVGMQIGNSGFSDIMICRRGLVQAAQSARGDGMVAGLCPGGEAYLSTYSAQWVTACLEYFRLTGDKKLLEELFPSAEKNALAFKMFLSDKGISNDAGWAFIDWGYVPNEGATDMGLNLHCYMSFRDMERWASILGMKEKSAGYKHLAEKLLVVISDYLNSHRTPSGYDWEKIGYHRTVLAILAGLVPTSNRHDAILSIKKHILNCFPNNPDAPRLSSPGANNPQLITPYFAHYAFPILIESGEMEFVLEQYRRCWGWALTENDNTWLEVFDTRWSHSHQWSGCPTWQLTRYVLGLRPRFDIGLNTFELDVKAGPLNSAEGDIPLPGNKKIHVQWKRSGSKLLYTLTTPQPLTIRIKDEKNGAWKELSVKDKFSALL